MLNLTIDCRWSHYKCMTTTGGCQNSNWEDSNERKFFIHFLITLIGNKSYKIFIKEFVL